LIQEHLKEQIMLLDFLPTSLASSLLH